MKFAGCYRILLDQCDEIVNVVQYNFNQLIYAQMAQGGSNAYNCSMPTNCNELFGAPVADGHFVINSAPSTAHLATASVAVASLLLAAVSA
jgi:hypothetical protein